MILRIPIFLIALLFPVLAHADTEYKVEGSKSFYALFGWGTQNQSDVNTYLHDLSESFSGSRRADTFDHALEFRLGEQAPINNVLSYGFEAVYQSSTERNINAFSGEPNKHRVGLRLLSLMGVVVSNLPTVPGLSFGGNAGIGFGKLVETWAYDRSTFDPPSHDYSVPDFTGSGFIGGVFLAYARDVWEKRALVIRGGYRWRNLGDFEGYRGWDASELAADREPFDFDFSGIFIQAGISLEHN